MRKESNMNTNERCYNYENGRCKKWNQNCDATIFTIDDFLEKLSECAMKDVCRESSRWGNYMFTLNDSQIDALKSGKILFFEDEYGYFLAYKNEE